MLLMQEEGVVRWQANEMHMGPGAFVFLEVIFISTRCLSHFTIFALDTILACPISDDRSIEEILSNILLQEKKHY